MFNMLGGMFGLSTESIARKEPEVGKYGVSTADTSDYGYETALLTKTGAWPVERYKSKRAALKGHAKWIKKSASGKPMRLRIYDCSGGSAMKNIEPPVAEEDGSLAAPNPLLELMSPPSPDDKIEVIDYEHGDKPKGGGSVEKCEKCGRIGMRGTVAYMGGSKFGYYTTWTHRRTTRIPADGKGIPVSDADCCEIPQRYGK